MSNRKEYILPNGKKAIFEYDVCEIGKVTLECMDELMGMIADRPQGKWTNAGVLTVHCSNCKSEFHELEAMNFCPNCGAQMKGADDE